MPGLAERVALGVSVDLDRRHREHLAREIIMVKAAIARLELPSTVPFGGPHLGEALEHIVVGDPDGVALDHDIEPAVPAVAARAPGGSHPTRWLPRLDRCTAGQE